VTGLGSRLVALLLVAVLAGACTDNADPKPLPSPSPSPSPSAPSSSTGPVAPTLPAEAKGKSAESAEAFSRYYVDVINYAMHTGDTSIIRSNATNACSVCEVIAKAIDQAYEGGGHLEGRGWVVKKVAPAVSTNGKSANVAVQVVITSQKSFDSPSASPSVTRETTGLIDLSLIEQHGSWTVSRLEAKT
jgi:hypothetical protein